MRIKEYQFRYQQVKIHVGLALISLAALTFAAYWGVTGHDFIIFDDGAYVYENPLVSQGLSIEGLAWAFDTAGKEDTYWHPLTWISHMLDVSLFGLQPAGHHLVSLLLHVANSLLLFLLLRQMTGADGRSLLVAGLFALHPVNVESVAWIAERKNLLSTFLWLLTLFSYLYYCRKPGLLRYLLIVLMFSCGLLAKPMLVTLPCVLLLLDYWPLGRIRSQWFSFEQSTAGIYRERSEYPLPIGLLVLEKLPLLALSGLSIYMTAVSMDKLGTTVPLSAVTLDLRIANALVSYLTYIGNMLWPVNLAVIYPYPVHMLPAWQVAGSALLLAGLSLVIFLAGRRRPFFITGWLWYLGTLTPVLGIIQGGLWPALADRWAYVPFIGLYVIVAWGGRELLVAGRIDSAGMKGLSATVLVILAILTWKQTGYWKNSIPLFKHTLAVTGPNCSAHDILGVALLKQGHTEEAISHFRHALRIKPDFVDALRNLGGALFQKGDSAAAIAAYTRALQIKPDSPRVLLNLGIVYEKQAERKKAIALYRRALEHKPDFDKAHYNLGVLLAAQGQPLKAIDHFTTAAQLNPRFEKAYINLGTTSGSLGRNSLAIAYFRKALKLNPKNDATHFNLGIALADQGDFAAAAGHYREALRINPEYVAAHNNLAAIHLHQANRTMAEKHLRQAIALDPGNSLARENLARLLSGSK